MNFQKQHALCEQKVLVCEQDHTALEKQVSVAELLTHRVCVFAWHFVVANLDSRRNVLSVVSAEARKILKALCSIWLFSRGVLEIASRLSRYTWFVRGVGSIPI